MMTSQGLGEEIEPDCKHTTSFYHPHQVAIKTSFCLL